MWTLKFSRFVRRISPQTRVDKPPSAPRCNMTCCCAKSKKTVSGDESRYSKVVEVFDGKDVIQACFPSSFAASS